MDDTSAMDPAHAWEGVWSELNAVGIVQGQPGPTDGSISCGRVAERCIRSLQLGSLNAMDVQNIGMLVQVAILAARSSRTS